MEKIVKDFKAEYYLDWRDRIEIGTIKEDIEELEKLGVTHIDIEPYIEYDCARLEITLIIKRLETDEEYDLRIQRKKDIEERNKQMELQRLAELKAKYE